MGFTTSGSLAALAMLAAPLAGHELPPRRAAAGALSPAASSAAAAVDSFHAALHRGDARAAAALLAEDALIFEEGHAERTKAEYAAQHLPADVEFSKLVSSTITRRVSGSSGNLAWITSEGRMTGTYKGRTLDRVTTETVVLRKQGEAWKIVHIHWSSATRT